MRVKTLTIGIVFLIMMVPAVAGSARSDVVFAAEDATPVMNNVVYIPQVVSGSGYTSDIVIVNPSVTTMAHAVVAFHLADGVPWEIGIASVASSKGVLFAMDETNTVEVEIEPLGSVTIKTDGLGDIDPGPPVGGLGSAKITSDIPVAATSRFKNADGASLAGFASAKAENAVIGPVARDAKLNTAVGIRNATDMPLTLELSLLNPAGEVPSVPGAPGVGGYEVEVELPANGRIAMFINELFPDANLDEFVGSILIEAAPVMVAGSYETPPPGSFAAIALEQLGSNVTLFTSLPMAPVIHDTDSE